MTRALLLNGTVGVGKSTVAATVGDLLSHREVPNAVVDVDELRRTWPAPADDPFHSRLALRNLAAVARTYVDVGVDVLVVAGVVETADERAATQRALDLPLVSCRLRLDAVALADRLARRHADDPQGRAWHLHRAPELAAVLEAAATDDHVLDLGDASPAVVADAVLRIVLA